MLATILDVAKRYDVDGIHLDDYFYPYRESRVVSRRVRGRRMRTRVAIEFPDDSTWKRFGRANGWTDRDAWRRANIDDFVEQLYRGVKAINPAIVVGISPFGIWRPESPPGVTGLDSFSEIYADSKKWLARGWLDFIAPQLYWELGGPEDRFRALDGWWRSVNPRARYVWPALYTSHVYGGRDAWPLGEIREQIATIRAARVGSTDAPGHIHFRLAALFADNNRLAADLATAAYSERAIVPPFPWLGPSCARGARRDARAHGCADVAQYHAGRFHTRFVGGSSRLAGAMAGGRRRSVRRERADSRRAHSARPILTRLPSPRSPQPVSRASRRWSRRHA